VNAKYISPVILAVQNVFNTMIHLPMVAGKQSFKREKRPTTEVTSMVTMSGPVSGFICLGLSTKLAFLLASKLLECEISDANADCIDAVGEVTNMIAGNAKSEFPDDGIVISVPKVSFKSAKDPYPTTAPVISIPFESQGEDFLVDMGIVWKSRSI
jgi:chemotaxis protein CheX